MSLVLTFAEPFYSAGMAGGSVSVSGVGTVTASGRKAARASVTVTGTGTVTASGARGADPNQAIITGAGIVTASGRKAGRGSAVVTGTGTITVSGGRVAGPGRFVVSFSEPFYVGPAAIINPPPPDPPPDPPITPPMPIPGGGPVTSSLGRFVVEFSEPFYGGVAAVASDVVPDQYPIALAGHPYFLDLNSDQFRHRSIPLLREQQDVQNVPAEASLNPEGLWRRSQDDWSHGAGQTYIDRPDSDPARFRSSKGVNPWTRWELSLLNATARKRTTTATNLSLTPVGTYLYAADGNSLLWTQDFNAETPVWTEANIAAGEAATAVRSVASDGFNVWAAMAAGGIHTTTRGALTSTHYSDLQADVLGYVNGRLMAAKDDAIYNVIASGAAPTALLDHPNSDFRWVGFTGGQTAIYAAGNSGDKSLVYKVTVKTDGSGLDVPSVAAELPDGEIIRSIGSYLGKLIFLGTDKGLRMAEVSDAAGNLSIGALIPTPFAVKAFEGQERFVWFGWTNYDNDSTGLGRLDPTVLVAPLAPAWASDLMAQTQGEVVSIATFGGRRVFAVAGNGFWCEDTANKTPQGTLDSGIITYGLSDAKIALFLDVRHRGTITGNYRAWLAGSDGTFTVVGSRSAGGLVEQFSVGQVRSEFFEIRHELNRDTVLTGSGPILIRSTLKSQVAADVGENIFVPILLSEKLDVGGNPAYQDVAAELEFLKELRRNRSLFIYQEGATNYSVTLEDMEWVPHHATYNNHAYTGTAVCKLKVIA